MFGTYVLVFLIVIVFDIVLGLILLFLPVAARNLISSVISGTLVAPFLALVVTLIYYRLTAAHEARGGAGQAQWPPAGPDATYPGPGTQPGSAYPGPGSAYPGPGSTSPGAGSTSPGPDVPPAGPGPAPAGPGTEPAGPAPRPRIPAIPLNPSGPQCKRPRRPLTGAGRGRPMAWGYPETNMPIGLVWMTPSSRKDSVAFWMVVRATPNSVARSLIDGSRPPGG